MILYSFRRCPYAIRARFTLIYGECLFEHREILLKEKPKSLLDFSPKGTVPVFLVGDKVIDESLDVIEWALENLPLCKELELKGEAYKEASSLILLNDTSFTTDLKKYKYPERFKFTKEEETQNLLNCLKFISLIENLLEESTFLFGKKASFADFSIFPFIRQCHKVDEERFTSSKLSKTLSWMDNISSSELFSKVMKKHPLYVEKS
jgi:glutathione S-transferase